MVEERPQKKETPLIHQGLIRFKHICVCAPRARVHSRRNSSLARTDIDAQLSTRVLRARINTRTHSQTCFCPSHSPHYIFLLCLTCKCAKCTHAGASPPCVPNLLAAFSFSWRLSCFLKRMGLLRFARILCQPNSRLVGQPAAIPLSRPNAITI